MADGKIKIDTRINTDDAIKDGKQLEKMADNCAKHIKNAFDSVSTVKGVEQAIQRQISTMQKAKEKANEYERQLEDVNAQMRSMESVALKDANLGFAGDTQRKIQTRADNSLTNNKDYQKLLDQSIKLEDSWGKQNQKIRLANSNVEQLEGKMSKLAKETDKASSKQDKLSNSTKKVRRSVDSTTKSTKDFGNQMTKSVDHGVRKIGRMALAVFSVRTAYTLVSKAANQYLQSNQDMSNQVQGIWTTMSNVIGPIINTIVGYISTFISYVNSLIKAFTGVDLIAKANASAMKNQAKATKDAGKSAEKAKKQLAGFDEMQVLNKDKSADSSVGNGLQTFSPDAIDVSEIKSKLEGLFEPIKSAWSNYGRGFTDSFFNALTNINGLVGSIGESLKEVWTNGTGEKTVSLILQILTDVFDIIGKIAKGIKEAWDKSGVGTSIIQRIWNIVNSLLKTVKSLTGFWAKIFEDIDWSPILKGLDSVLGLIDDLMSKLAEFYDILLKNILEGDWSGVGSTISDAFISIFDTVSEYISNIDWLQLGYDIAKFIGDGIMALVEIVLNIDWIGLIASVFKFIREAVVASGKLLIGAVGGILTSIWEAITKAFTYENLLSWCQGVIQSIVDAIADIGQWYYDKFTEAYQFIVKVFEPIGKWFSDRKQDIINAFFSIGQWFSDTFVNAYNAIKSAFKDIGSFFSGCWKNITSVFGNVAGWFKDKFSQAWTAVKDVFSTGGKIFDGIKDGILNGLKSIVNAIIVGINKVVKIPFDGINSALKSIKKVSILGFKPFDWIGTISVPQIPKLARGGIVNHPTQFISGEAGKEAILPLQNNTQWMEDLADFINEKNIGSDGDKVINLYMDGERLFQWILKRKKKERFVLNG